jgi:hypothetical protein
MIALVDEARLLVEALETEEFVDGDLLSDFAKRARQSASHISPDAQQAVLNAFNELIEAVSHHQNKTQVRLKQIRTNRKALRKFNHIRQFSRGQRLHNSY